MRQRQWQVQSRSVNRSILQKVKEYTISIFGQRRTIMSVSFKFRRGDCVRSIKDGVQGVIIGYQDSLYNMPAYMVSILKHEKQQEYPGECFDVTIDEVELVKIDKLPMVDEAYIKEFDDTFCFQLGNKVRHKYSDSEGIVTRRYQFSNGCNYVQITMNKFDDKGSPVELFLSENTIDLVPDPEPVIKSVEPESHVEKKSAKPPQPVRTGGPRESIPNRW